MENQLTNFVPIGKMGKGFGLNYFIRLSIDPEKELIWEKVLQAEDAIFVGIDDFKIPFLIETYDDQKELIKFQKVDSEADMKSLVGQQIFVMERPEYVEDVNDVNVFQNLEIINNENGASIGKIDRIEEYPAHPMAIIVTDEREILIPLVEEWIEHIDAEHMTVRMNLPEGLLDDDLQ